MSVLSALNSTRRPAAAFVIVGLFWGSFAALVPVLKSGLGAGDGAFGAALLGSAIGLVSAIWFAPRIDRRLGPRGLQTAAVLLGLALMMPALAGSLVAFFFIMICVGAASGLLDVSMNARVSEVEARTGRSLMNANHGMFSLAYAVAAIFTGLGREAGLPPIAILACVSAVALLIATWLRMEVDSAAPPEDGSAGDYPTKTILLCGLLVLVAFMSEATVEAWSALHIERTLHGGAAEGALGPAMLGITMAVGRFSGQAVSERFSETSVSVAGLLLAASGAIVAATAPSPPMAYLGFGILGLGVSVVGPMGLALVGKLVPPHVRTEAISRAAVMGFAGFFFAPTLMGLMSEFFGLRIAFGSVAVLLLLGLPLIAAITRLPRPLPREETP